MKTLEWTTLERQLARWGRRIAKAKPLASHERLARRCLDVQFELAGDLSGLLVDGRFHGCGSASSLMLNAFLSNTYHLCAVIGLNSRGFYGSARPILRLVYEGLMVAKFCSLSGENELFRRWDAGESISLGRDVFGQVSVPQMPELRQLWRLLCRVTHFSNCSGQAALDLDLISMEGKYNYSVVFMLLLMNDHLLRMHVLDKKLAYYLGRYSDDDTWRRRRDAAGSVAKIVHSFLRDAAPRVVREYTARWHLRAAPNKALKTDGRCAPAA